MRKKIKRKIEFAPFSCVFYDKCFMKGQNRKEIVKLARVRKYIAEVKISSNGF